MSINKTQGVCLLFAFTFLSFAIPALQMGWQGTGTMTESNMTQIRTLIIQNPVPVSYLPSDFDTVAMNISTQLNKKWDPAWNVVIYSLASNVDAIVYGYAYHNHWLWFNGLVNPGDSSKFMTYIIWKDYNCIEWRSLNSTATGFSSAQYAVISPLKNAITADQINNDLWNTAYNLVLALQANSVFAGGAFTAIMAQYPNPSCGGYVCIKNRKVIMLNYVASTGNMILMQMR